MPNEEELKTIEKLEGIRKSIEKQKPILCLDFDGVCHSYTSGWQGIDVIPDKPVDGLFEFIEKAKDVFDIQIFSTRSKSIEGISAMRQWFNVHWTEYLFRTRPELQKKYYFFEIDFLSFPQEKPPAFISLDDRTLTFTGIFPEPEKLLSFKAWNKS